MAFPVPSRRSHEGLPFAIWIVGLAEPSFGCAKFFISADRELGRLIRREGFTARLVGGVTESFPADGWESARQIRQAARRAPPDQWEGFQVFGSVCRSDRVHESVHADQAPGIRAAFARTRRLQ